MTILSKATALASLTSCIRDIHYSAKVYSKNESAKSTSATFISGVIASSKSDKVSLKDSERRNWFMINNPYVPVAQTTSQISGYIKGLGNGITRYIPNILLAIPALLIKKHPKIANLSALGLGILEGVDFLKNIFGLGQRSDYLK